MEKLNHKPRITSVEEAIFQFEKKINPFLIIASDEIRNEIIQNIHTAINDGSINKRKTRLHLYSSVKKSVLENNQEKKNMSIQESLIFGEDFGTAHEEIKKRFTNVNIENINGGMI